LDRADELGTYPGTKQANAGVPLTPGPTRLLAAPRKGACPWTARLPRALPRAALTGAGRSPMERRTCHQGWQIFYGEFDGRRRKRASIKVIGQ